MYTVRNISEVILGHLYYVQNSIISHILVIIMLYYVFGQGGKRQAQDSLFVMLLFSALSLLSLDLCLNLLSGRVYPGSRIVLSLVAFFFYLLSPLPGYFYFLYVDQLDKRWEQIPEKFGLLAAIPLLTNALFTIVSLFNGMIFSIDVGSTYSRGSHFYIIIVINLLYFIGGQLQSIRNLWIKKNVQSFLNLLLPTPIVAGAFVQVYIEGVEVMLLAFALSLLMGFLYNQNTYANRDFLTGLYNRSIGEEYLNYLIQHKTKGKIIGGILLDIDGFKQVNDQYGHDQGDYCLRLFSQVLRESFSRKWLICRYGGDEFLLFRQIDSRSEMDDAYLKFTKKLDQLNEEGRLPFLLHASVGKGVDAELLIGSLPFFLKLLDERMYQSKKQQGRMQLQLARR